MSDPYDNPTHAMVTVFTRSRTCSEAVCTCGYEGRIRWLRSLAVLDAHEHSAHTGHRPDSPLVREVVRPPRRRGPRGWITFGALVGAALLSAAPARANPVDDYAVIEWPVVCGALDLEPTLRTIDVIGSAIVRDTGWSFYDAGQVIGISVFGHCGRHAGLVNRYIAVYAGKQQLL